MSKLACRCGNIIVDQTSDLPYKAALLHDEYKERFFNDTSFLANELLATASTGCVDELLERYFGKGRPKPTEFFGDKFTKVYLSCTRRFMNASAMGAYGCKSMEPIN